ncbi:MAG TPA: hypothetical protein VM029_12785 [Opitutaceae bacterium]|nr:hypothetical protein [Opitutaceae bacterium]
MLRVLSGGSVLFAWSGGTDRLGGRVVLAELVTKTKTWFVDLGGYPQWLVVLVGTLFLAFGIWLLIKLLKLALWILFFVVLIGGVLWAAYLLVG